MDIFHIDLLLKLYYLFEKTENKRKRGRVRPFFLKKKQYSRILKGAEPYMLLINRLSAYKRTYHWKT